MPTRMKRIEVSRNPFLLKKYFINIIFNLSHFIAAAEEPDNRTSAGNISTKKDRKRSKVLV
jgi:hypothetical protein